MVEMSPTTFSYGFYDIIIFAVFIFVLMFFISPSILRLFKIFSRARSDYRLARGYYTSETNP
jgi:hypothetical protein